MENIKKTALKYQNHAAALNSKLQKVYGKSGTDCSIYKYYNAFSNNSVDKPDYY